jgi:microcompartment protein CcmL/EutN
LNQSSLGFLETRGFVALMQATDTMLKAADVRLVKYERVGGGLVTVCISGDLAAVRAAIEAGLAALHGTAPVTSAVLGKPGQAVWSMLRPRYSPQHLAVSGAVGLVETRGFLPSVVAVDAMDKAADISFLGYENIGDGLVTAMISGELSAVKYATEAGVAAAGNIGEVLSSRVITRPQEDIEQVFLLGSGALISGIPQIPGVAALPSRTPRRGKHR